MKNCLYVYYQVNRDRPAASVLCKYLHIISYPMFERPHDHLFPGSLIYCIVALCPKLRRPRNHYCFVLKLGQVESELFNEIKIISNCVFLDVT